MPHTRSIINNLSNKARLATTFIAFLFSLAACQTAISNELAVGSLARTSSNQTIEIPLYNPVCLNGASQAQILSQRSYVVQKIPQLLASAYNPSQDFFGQIVDGKPWWGMPGIFVYGAGAKSCDGASEEARFIVNPFLLVGANSWSAEIWDPNKFSEKEASDKNFPYCFMPASLHFYPREKIAKVIYDITDYHARLGIFDYCRKEKNNISDFGLVAYNARDFGYHYIYFDQKASANVENVNPTTRATEIRQMIHCGGSCGLSTGCNNMSPAQDEIDHLRLKALPAKAMVKLWKEAPDSTNSEADMKLVLEFR